MPNLLSSIMRHRAGPILLSWALLLTIVVPIYAQAGQAVHVVQPGETLYRIALHYGVSVDQITAANGLPDPGLIYVGQALIIPVAAKPVSVAVPASPVLSVSQTHIVQAGETLLSISWRYGIPQQSVASANHLANWNLIYIGQHLTIPGVPNTLPSTRFIAPSVRLNVPLYGQLRSLSCEAAVARMLASYYGVAQAEDWFQSALGQSDDPHLGFRGNVDGVFGWIDDYGTYAEPVARILQGIGISATVRYDMSYDDLYAILNQGVPVIVWTSPRTDNYDMPEGYRLVPEEHTYIVVGYDDAGFIVYDPLYGGRILQMPAIPGWESFENMAVVGPSLDGRKP